MSTTVCLWNGKNINVSIVTVIVWCDTCWTLSCQYAWCLYDQLVSLRYNEYSPLVSLTVLVYHLLISEKCKYIRTSWQLHISKKKYFDERLLWLRNRTSFVLYLKVFSISENWSTIELNLHNYVFIS
jgi:hypothetical protein